MSVGLETEKYAVPDEDDKVVIVPVYDENDSDGDIPEYGDSV